MTSMTSKKPTTKAYLAWPNYLKKIRWLTSACQPMKRVLTENPFN